MCNLYSITTNQAAIINLPPRQARFRTSSAGPVTFSC
jgi:hypothetical protein